MKFEYTPEVSLGNVIQIITILFGIGAGYGALVKANELQDQIITQHDREISASRIAIREAQSELKAEVKELSHDVKKLDEKFTNYVIEQSSSKPKR